MNLHTVAAHYWPYTYLAVGFAVFVYVRLRGGTISGGWVNQGSGPALYSGGFFQTLFACVLLWLPVLLIQCLPNSIRRRLAGGLFAAICAIMLLWPLAVVGVILLRRFQGK